MRIRGLRWWFCIVAVPCCIFLSQFEGKSSDVAESKKTNAAKISPDVVSFLKNNCYRCHGSEKQKGSIRLDNMPTVIGDEAIAQRWQDILDVLNLDQMPPETARQPSKEELSNALETLTANLADARKRLTDTGGRVVLRQLNRREYKQTIRELFGIPVDVTMLPDDSRVDGFDTLGQGQSFSSLHLERYLKLGRVVLDQVIPPRKQRTPRPIDSHFEPEERASHDLNRQMPFLEKRIKNFMKSIADGRKDHVYRMAITKKEVELTNKYLGDPLTKSGVRIPYFGLHPSTFISLGKTPPIGKYKITVRCGTVAKSPDHKLFLKVIRGEYRSKVPDSIDYFHVTGTVDNPQTIEFTAYIDNIRSNRFAFERRNLEREKLKQYEKSRDYYFKYKQLAYLQENRQPDLWIDSIHYEGPLPDSTSTLSAKTLFAGAIPDDLSDADVRKLIERFAHEAFRHQQPDAKYVDLLMKVYKSSRNHGDTFRKSLKDALVIVLASPRFLFLNEPASQSEKRRELTDRELAVRLSYFLWSAPPDAELYRLAEQGKLRDPKILAGQVDRMIRSEQSALFIETFLTHWLEFERLDLIKPEATPTNLYDDAVQRNSRQEVFAFFNHLLQKDLPAKNLIDSDFVVVNSVMAQFYGLENVAGDSFRKVALPENSVRGGLLGQSALLTLTGTGERTSPVERGAFVLRKLLDRPPPPAPANVPMLDEEKVGVRSIRDTLSIHMTKPQCSSCHRRIDPLGFGMENFDPVGLWRTKVSSTDGKATFSIEPGGVMPDGKRKFADFFEMKNRLGEEHQAFVKGLTKALMTYSYGRTIGFSDQPLVERIVTESAKDDYRLRSLIHRIIQSEPFLTK